MLTGGSILLPSSALNLEVMEYFHSTEGTGHMNEQYPAEDANLPVTMTLADHYEGIREAQASAWSEGFHDGLRQDAEGDDGPRFANPYEAQSVSEGAA